MGVCVPFFAPQLKELHFLDFFGGVYLQAVDVDIGELGGPQLFTAVEGAVDAASVDEGAVVGGGPPAAAVDAQQEGGVGVVGAFDEDGGEVVEGAVVEGNGAVDGGELVVAVSLEAVFEGDVASVAVDVETVEVGAFYVGVGHVVGAEDAPVGDGSESPDAGVAQVVQHDAVARVVGARVGAPDRDGVEEYVGGVVDADDGVVGANEIGAGRGYDDVTEGGLREVF